MLVSLDAITFDLNGSVVFNALPGSEFGTLIRRANKVQTLNQGVAVNDFGYADADREFRILVKADQALGDSLRYLVKNHAQVYVTTEEGVFQAIPEFDPTPGRWVLNLSITSKLSS